MLFRSKRKPAPPSKINPQIPSSLDYIVLKAISKNPVERYQKADELAEDLRRVLCDLPPVKNRFIMLKNSYERHKYSILSISVFIIATFSTIFLYDWFEKIKKEGKSENKNISQKHISNNTFTYIFQPQQMPIHNKKRK